MSRASPEQSDGQRISVKMLSPLSAQDFDDLAALWVESWRGVFPQIDFIRRTSWLRGQLADVETVRKGWILAGYLDHRLSGFLTIEPDSGRLDQLAVHPRAQGTGLAQNLLAAARAYSPEKITLDVNADNARAVAFYMGAGFKRIGEGVNAASGMKTFRLEWRPD